MTPMTFDQKRRPDPAATLPRFLTIPEVMAMLRIRSKVTLAKYVKAGLPAHQMVKNGQILFDPAEVETWVKSRCTSPDPGQVA